MGGYVGIGPGVVIGGIGDLVVMGGYVGIGPGVVIGGYVGIGFCLLFHTSHCKSNSISNFVLSRGQGAGRE
jgi:hypothetical protein